MDSISNFEGKSALGLAADHAKMEDFLEIAGSLVIAGCRGTEKDWAILGELCFLNLSIRSFAGKYPQKKLLVLLEELRTHRERNTLKLVLTISCYVTTEQFLKNDLSQVPCQRSSDERIAYCKCSVEPRHENQSVGDSWEPA